MIRLEFYQISQGKWKDARRVSEEKVARGEGRVRVSESLIKPCNQRGRGRTVSGAGRGVHLSRGSRNGVDDMSRNGSRSGHCCAKRVEE